MIKEKVEELSNIIKKISKKELNLMEFCGTHTHEIFKYGIRQLLPKNIQLLSGPGCPVCVTSQRDIDYLITLVYEENFGVITFGDLINVPGSNSSLNKLRLKGKEIKVVYSPLESVKIAKENKNKNYILVGIGFETTAPNIAYTILKAEEEKLKNLFFLSLHKLTPPAMKAILDMGEIKIDGIIGPGHVSTIIGRKGWLDVFNNYRIPIVITGFKPVEILYGLYKLIELLEKNEIDVFNAYESSVLEDGNKKALEMMYQVFEIDDAEWRGLGILKNSGLKIKENFKNLDIKNYYNFNVETKEIPNCKCGEVLRGIIKPINCPLFGKICTPTNPIGPCMVSSEGACSAYYIYGGKNE
ncbi:MAG: hydrogenase formation protein HypD [Caldisericia bacterium]